MQLKIWMVSCLLNSHTSYTCLVFNNCVVSSKNNVLRGVSWMLKILLIISLDHAEEDEESDRDYEYEEV